MAFIIEQKIKGNIYLYRVESQWDKVKKKKIQKRTYLGPKYPKTKKKTIRKEIDFVNKSYGNIVFLEQIAQTIGIHDIVKNCFEDDYKDILALAYYGIMEGNPFYLFHYWLDEHFLPDVTKLDSKGVSNLFETLGKKEQLRIKCLENWMQHLQPLKGLFFDISSISSYSQQISFIEWGYNRDKESLAQLNIGMVFCEEKKLPIYYQLYPGSIVDVSTLENCKKYLNTFGLQDFLFILDRGFFSTANILVMNGGKQPIKFIVGLPFRLKKAKQLIAKYKRELSKIETAFVYKQHIVNHLKSNISFKEQSFDAHLFYNEQMALDFRHQLLRELLDLESKLKLVHLDTLKQWLDYKKEHIVGKYQPFFKWNRSTKKIEKNLPKIKAHIDMSAYFILLTNEKQISPQQLFQIYYNKDLVEKVFDLLKNELDGKRLRTHNDFTTQGKLFVTFIALTIYSEIIRVMNKQNLFKNFTVKELLLELKKIKINFLPKDGKPMISEISKKQKQILKIFQTDLFRGY